MRKIGLRVSVVLLVSLVICPVGGFAVDARHGAKSGKNLLDSSAQVGGTALHSAGNSGNGSVSGGVNLYTGTVGAGYKFPVPPGINGMTPVIQAYYAHRSGNSWVGWNWHLEPDYIRRVADTKSQDWLTDGMDRLETDQVTAFNPAEVGPGGRQVKYEFNIAGMTGELVHVFPVDVDAAATGIFVSFYRCRVECGFTMFERVSDGWGADVWYAKTSKGVEYTFRAYQDDGVDISSAGSEGVIWYLQEAEDAFQNKIEYKYRTLTTFCPDPEQSCVGDHIGFLNDEYRLLAPSSLPFSKVGGSGAYIESVYLDKIIYAGGRYVVDFVTDLEEADSAGNKWISYNRRDYYLQARHRPWVDWGNGNHLAAHRGLLMGDEVLVAVSVSDHTTNPNGDSTVTYCLEHDYLSTDSSKYNAAHLYLTNIYKVGVGQTCAASAGTESGSVTYEYTDIENVGDNDVNGGYAPIERAGTDDFEMKYMLGEKILAHTLPVTKRKYYYYYTMDDLDQAWELPLDLQSFDFDHDGSQEIFHAIEVVESGKWTLLGGFAGRSDVRKYGNEWSTHNASRLWKRNRNTYSEYTEGDGFTPPFPTLIHEFESSLIVNTYPTHTKVDNVNTLDTGIRYDDFDGDGNLDIVRWDCDGQPAGGYIAYSDEPFWWTDDYTTEELYQEPISIDDIPREGPSIQYIQMYNTLSSNDGNIDFLATNETVPLPVGVKTARLEYYYDAGNILLSSATLWKREPREDTCYTFHKSTPTGVRFADVNGDGLKDIVQSFILGRRHDGQVMSPLTSVKVYYNNVPACLDIDQASRTAQDCWTSAPGFTDSFPEGRAFAYLLRPGQSKDTYDMPSNFIMDINEDGLNDLVFYPKANGHPNFTSWGEVYLNTGVSWEYSPLLSTEIKRIAVENPGYFNGTDDSSVSYALPARVDYDGDGSADLLFGGAGAGSRVYLGLGSGLFSEKIELAHDIPFSAVNGFSVDVTMDGYEDFIDGYEVYSYWEPENANEDACLNASEDAPICSEKSRRAYARAEEAPWSASIFVTPKPKGMLEEISFPTGAVRRFNYEEVWRSNQINGVWEPEYNNPSVAWVATFQVDENGDPATLGYGEQFSRKAKWFAYGGPVYDSQSNTFRGYEHAAVMAESRYTTDGSHQTKATVYEFATTRMHSGRILSLAKGVTLRTSLNNITGEYQDWRIAYPGDVFRLNRRHTLSKVENEYLPDCSDGSVDCEDPYPVGLPYDQVDNLSRLVSKASTIYGIYNFPYVHLTDYEYFNGADYGGGNDGLLTLLPRIVTENGRGATSGLRRIAHRKNLLANDDPGSAPAEGAYPNYCLKSYVSGGDGNDAAKIIEQYLNLQRCSLPRESWNEDAYGNKSYLTRYAWSRPTGGLFSETRCNGVVGCDASNGVISYTKYLRNSNGLVTQVSTGPDSANLHVVSETTYDSFGQFPEYSSSGPMSGFKNNEGTTVALKSHYSVDTNFASLVKVEGVNGETLEIKRDAFGRMINTRGTYDSTHLRDEFPQAVNHGVYSTDPLSEYEYRSNYDSVDEIKADGIDWVQVTQYPTSYVEGGEAPDSMATKTITDGWGQMLATCTKEATASGDWVVSGYYEMDPGGINVYREYDPIPGVEECTLDKIKESLSGSGSGVNYTELQYDSYGRVRTTTTVSPNMDNLPRTTISYYGLQQYTVTTDTGNGDAVTRSQWDTFGNIEEKLSNVGSASTVMKYYYDYGKGNISQIHNLVVSRSGRRTLQRTRSCVRNVYDSQGRLILLKKFNGSARDCSLPDRRFTRQIFKYDYGDRKVCEYSNTPHADAANGTIIYKYDSIGRPVRVYHTKDTDNLTRCNDDLDGEFSGDRVNAVYGYAIQWDGDDQQPASQRYTKGKIAWVYDYNFYDKTLDDKIPNMRKSEFTYNINGTLAGMANPDGAMYYAYDRIGRLEGVVYPGFRDNGRVQTYNYNPAGLLMSSQVLDLDSGGVVGRNLLEMEAEYNGLGQMVSFGAKPEEESGITKNWLVEKRDYHQGSHKLSTLAHYSASNSIGSANSRKNLYSEDYEYYTDHNSGSSAGGLGRISKVTRLYNGADRTEEYEYNTLGHLQYSTRTLLDTSDPNDTIRTNFGVDSRGRVLSRKIDYGSTSYKVLPRVVRSISDSAARAFEYYSWDYDTYTLDPVAKMFKAEYDSEGRMMRVHDEVTNSEFSDYQAESLCDTCQPIGQLEYTLDGKYRGAKRDDTTGISALLLPQMTYDYAGNMVSHIAPGSGVKTTYFGKYQEIRESSTGLVPDRNVINRYWFGGRLVATESYDLWNAANAPDINYDSFTDNSILDVDDWSIRTDPLNESCGPPAVYYTEDDRFVLDTNEIDPQGSCGEEERSIALVSPIVKPYDAQTPGDGTNSLEVSYYAGRYSTISDGSFVFHVGLIDTANYNKVLTAQGTVLDGQDYIILGIGSAGGSVACYPNLPDKPLFSTDTKITVRMEFETGAPGTTRGNTILSVYADDAELCSVAITALSPDADYMFDIQAIAGHIGRTEKSRAVMSISSIVSDLTLPPRNVTNYLERKSNGFIGDAVAGILDDAADFVSAVFSSGQGSTAIDAVTVVPIGTMVDRRTSIVSMFGSSRLPDIGYGCAAANIRPETGVRDLFAYHDEFYNRPKDELPVKEYALQAIMILFLCTAIMVFWGTRREEVKGQTLFSKSALIGLSLLLAIITVPLGARSVEASGDVFKPAGEITLFGFDYRGSPVLYITPTELGNIGENSNDNYTVIESDPYGDQLKKHTNGGLDHQADSAVSFMGSKNFGGNELKLLGARVYHPQIGSFLMPDPIIGNPADSRAWEPYVYAFADPVNYSDPTGLFGVSASWEVGGVTVASGHFNVPDSCLGSSEQQCSEDVIGGVTNAIHEEQTHFVDDTLGEVLPAPVHTVVVEGLDAVSRGWEASAGLHNQALVPIKQAGNEFWNQYNVEIVSTALILSNPSGWPGAAMGIRAGYIASVRNGVNPWSKQGIRNMLLGGAVGGIMYAGVNAHAGAVAAGIYLTASSMAAGSIGATGGGGAGSGAGLFGLTTAADYGSAGLNAAGSAYLKSYFRGNRGSAAATSAIVGAAYALDEKTRNDTMYLVLTSNSREAWATRIGIVAYLYVGSKVPVTKLAGGTYLGADSVYDNASGFYYGLESTY